MKKADNSTTIRNIEGEHHTVTHERYGSGKYTDDRTLSAISHSAENLKRRLER